MLLSSAIPCLSLKEDPTCKCSPGLVPSDPRASLKGVTENTPNLGTEVRGNGIRDQLALAEVLEESCNTINVEQ